ncbi:MAG: HEAT repeat domain-containing protein [Pirellulaceae bacterium]
MALLLPLVFAGSLPAYTIGSPEVLAMVQDGLKFLETSKNHHHVGGDALIGMTLTKNGYPESHPRVARAIKRCTEAAVRDRNNYELALIIIFLCDVGPQKYHGTINAYLQELFRRQSQQGDVWTYEGQELGDTSQSQYGVLAMWTASHAGFDVPVDRIEKACNWLIRTQTPAGAFGYHARDPGNYERRNQDEVTLSVVAAGLGSIYICADMLGMTSAPAEIQIRTELPPALVPVVAAREERASRSRSVAPRYLTRAQIDGNKWMQSNYKIKQNIWPFYYLYALERYHSFREIAEGRKEDSPFWYNDGVEYLLSTQQENGSFRESTTTVGLELSTAFAVLFLIRSTKKAIGEASEGRLRGGVGLPSNDSKMALYGGRIVAADVTKSLSDLMNLLEDQETAELKDLISFSPDTAFVIDDPAAYQEQMAQLRRMAAHKSYEVRMVAVQALGQTRDLDNVPALIYALSDPDARVARAARDGLRFISRRLEGFGLTESIKPGDRGPLILKWKQWYRTIRPDAPLLEGE